MEGAARPRSSNSQPRRTLVADRNDDSHIIQGFVALGGKSARIEA